MADIQTKATLTRARLTAAGHDDAFKEALEQSFDVLAVIIGVAMPAMMGASCTSKMSLDAFVKKVRTHLQLAGVKPDAAKVAALEFSRRFLKYYMGNNGAGKLSKFFTG